MRVDYSNLVIQPLGMQFQVWNFANDQNLVSSYLSSLRRISEFFTSRLSLPFVAVMLPVTSVSLLSQMIAREIIQASEASSSAELTTGRSSTH